MKLFDRLFRRVTYTCTDCGAVQQIPLRRVHDFERFHDLVQGEPVLILCPICQEGVQCPSPYRSHNDYFVSVDPFHPPTNAFLHDLY